MGNDENILSMQALKNIYEVVTQNLKIAWPKVMDNNNPVPTKLKEGDLVLIKDHTAKDFQPNYVGNYRIVSFKGNQVEVHKTKGGNTTWVTSNRCEIYSPSGQCDCKTARLSEFWQKTQTKIKSG